MESEARYRRKVRIEKLRALRNLHGNKCQPEIVGSNPVVTDRKLRNRESAFNSRKRKNDELIYLQNQVQSLAKEVENLKRRLQCYESQDAPIGHIQCNVIGSYGVPSYCNILEPAVF